MYFQENNTQSEIADRFNVTQKIVFRWFKSLGIKSRVAAKRNQSGEKNHMWKGDNASYFAFHVRVRKQNGKANKCDQCGRSDSGIRYDWANKTGKFNEISDYVMLCRSCHFKIDGLKNNFPNRRDKILVNKSKTLNKNETNSRSVI